jgi:hypothetical protein
VVLNLDYFGPQISGGFEWYFERKTIADEVA